MKVFINPQLMYYNFRLLGTLSILLLIQAPIFGINIESVPAPNSRNIGGFENPNLGTGQFQYWSSSDPTALNSSGYRFTSGTGISNNQAGFTQNNPNAPQGTQVAFIQAATGHVRRSINITKATHYRFSLKAAIRNQSNARKKLRIFVNDIELGEYTINSINYEEQVSLPIFLPVGTHTIKIEGSNFTSGTNYTVLIDDIQLQEMHSWHDPAAWQGGNVPSANDHVIIKSNSIVGFNSNIAVRSIRVEGQLLVAQNRNVYLDCKYLLVTGPDALFQIGQKLTPYTKDAIITLNANRNDLNSSNTTINHSGMGTKFVGAMNSGKIILHGDTKTSWVRLSNTSPVNSSTIRVQKPLNWKIGDQIIIASSRPDWNEAEKRTITDIQDISNNRQSITLNAPLDYPHIGVTKTYTNGSNTWTANLGAEVGMLTHNIKIQGDANSEADNGFGAHSMIMMGASAQVSYVEFFRVGQKSILGRYPFHWHLLANDGEGQHLMNSSIHQSFNRAITIHGTHQTTVERNVCYDHIGHGVFLEDGAEEDNIIKSNLVLLTKRPAPGEELTPSDNQFDVIQNRTPASFWITNPKNTFQGNVAAGTQGTGYWFSFPQKPMGASANDTRFDGIQPHRNPLTLFKGNRAHSCMSGLDVFDQLDENHSIKKNGGWDHSGLHLIENCLWYANDLAIYTGTGRFLSNLNITDNLVFRNNILIENKVGTMFASYNILESSVIVARSGENLYPTTQELFAYRTYDGAGQVRNSHFVGWSDNTANVNLLINTGAGLKHPNHWFTGNTTDAGIPIIKLPNYSTTRSYLAVHTPNHPRDPHLWSVILRDVTGDIGGKANTSIISNHPFQLTGNEHQPSNWTRAYRSDHKFVLATVSYSITAQDRYDLTVTRSKDNTPSSSVLYLKSNFSGSSMSAQLPVIVNDDFVYTYDYESVPAIKRIRITMDDAEVGDHYISKFKNFGKLGGVTVQLQQANIPQHTSYNSLENSNSSGYYLNSRNLFVKLVATQRTQAFVINWTDDSNYPNTAADTDGDLISDTEEVSLGRNPFHAGDLAAEFDFVNGQVPAYLPSFLMSNIDNVTPTGTTLAAVSSSTNGDAKVINNSFDFLAEEVTSFEIRMKASTTTPVQLFFGSNLTPGYSGTRVVNASYTTPGSWQTLTFNVASHPDWDGRIRNLRLDPVSGTNISFEIDYMRANGAIPKTSNNNSNRDKDGGKEVPVNAVTVENAENNLLLFPNPVQDKLTIQGIAPNSIFQIIDINGRVVKSGVLNGNQVEVSTLSKGNYWIQLEEENYPFIKQ